MANKVTAGPRGSSAGSARYRPAGGRIRLWLPIVLGCCIAIVHGTIEEMMIAPIEVIEEWGCYDTEIRLTCGNLESKIAILEARFTPRCQEGRNCVYMDENSVAHPFASQKVDKLILEETEAGRRFLATLRRNHEKEMEENAGGGPPAGTTRELTAARSAKGEAGGAMATSPVIVAARSQAKEKRSSLRATLEHLIVRYLRRLTSGDNDDDDGEGQEEATRYRRAAPVVPYRGEASLTVVGLPAPDVDDPSGGAGTGFSNSMEITLLTNDTDTNLTGSWDGSEQQQQQQQQQKDSGNGYGFSGSLVSGLAWDRSVELADDSESQQGDGGARLRIAGGGASGKRDPAQAGGDHDDDGDGGGAVFLGASNAHGGSDVSATRDKLRDGGDGMQVAGPRSESADGGVVKSPGSGGGLRRQQQKPRQRECGSVRKRVSQLDRFELERSMRNGSFREYNIRNALNYRYNLYIPVNHTRHSNKFYFDIFSYELRCAIVGFLALVTLLNALVMRRHSPCRHLLFLYELLSGAVARPHRRGQQHVPNRMFQLLLGVVQEIVSCALATFLVANLSIPVVHLPLRSVKDLAHHPEYKLCVPLLLSLIGHIAGLARSVNFKNKYDHACHWRTSDPAQLARYLCNQRRTVVLLASDVFMNNMFADRELLGGCELVPIERGLVKNWIAIPVGSRFRDADKIRRFFVQLKSTGLLQKHYRHLLGAWGQRKRRQTKRWADIPLARMKWLMLLYVGAICCSGLVLLAEILVAKIAQCRLRKKGAAKNVTPWVCGGIALFSTKGNGYIFSPIVQKQGPSCSGKNHCSFVFSQDHPFAVVWKEGTVRIKYICMEDFRISKYCGGHLIVGNEVQWEPLDGDEEDDDDVDGNGDGEDQYDQDRESSDHRLTSSYGGDRAGISTPSWQQPKDSTLDGADTNGFADGGAVDFRDESTSVVREALERGYGGGQYRRLARAGEPHAEALQAATVHSFHNLKIFKPIDEPEPQHQQQQQQQQQHQQRLKLNDTDEHNPEKDATRYRGRQRQKVFSQDFRVLKILPSNLDVVEDIKQIGNEYYFKKDVEIVVDDSENEIVDGKSRPDADAVSQGAMNFGTTGTTSDGSEMTEMLDIVVLPAPTKDVEIYDSELLPTPVATPRPDADISVIGLITPTRMVTMAYTTASPAMKMASDSASVEEPSAAPETAGVETTLGYWDEDRLDLPEREGAENRTGFAGEEPATDAAFFSFNNRTFQNIEDTVRRQELAESQGPYPPLGNYDDDGDDATEVDDFDDDDDADADGTERENGYGFASSNHGPDGFHKKYISVQRTQLKHPLHQGFLMTPSYPKYYIGDSVCRWTLHAGVHQRIKLTVLDLALRYDDECRDYLQVVDLNTNQTLFRSCTESSRPIEIVSIQERMEVSIRTTTKVIYPKRGVLIHYTALGCEVPLPTPVHMRLVRRTEHRAKYVCDPLYVFPDTGESSRELICTAKHTWNRPLPACIEKRATEGSGLVSHYEQTRRFGDIDSMSDKQADTVYDILIPSFIIAGLFIVNGIVFAVIMRYRNKRKQRLDLESKELAEL